MTPGELALVCIRNPQHAHTADAEVGQQGEGVCHSVYGYGTCEQELPPGIYAGDELDFEVELLEFDKEARWQVREGMHACLRKCVYACMCECVCVRVKCWWCLL